MQVAPAQKMQLWIMSCRSSLPSLLITALQTAEPNEYPLNVIDWPEKIGFGDAKK